MKTYAQILALCACLAGASRAEAQSANYLYNYQTPMLSVQAGLQIGKTNEIIAVQNSATNVVSVTQIGPIAQALVIQTGRVNNASVTQISSSLPFLMFGP